MDNAVALVQAYLRINGYFTVAEFPILEGSHGQFREVTDLDILASLSRGPGHLTGSRIATEASFEVDRELGELGRAWTQATGDGRDAGGPRCII